MKVIVAGFPKTGTKSMYAALRELDFNVYDFTENFQFLNKEWCKIMKTGGTIEDFRKMYENVDAVTDVPGCFFWDEIHKAFPDSKIILTQRKNEVVWFESFKRQILHNEVMKFRLLFFSPTCWRIRRFGFLMWTTIFGYNTDPWLFGTPVINEMVLKMKYRRHCANVIQNAPKDKLLVYNVEEGWEPLCKFLNVEVPSTKFPHKNVRGNIIEEFMKINPVFLKMKREAMFGAGVAFLLLSYGGFKLIKASPSTLFKSGFSNFFGFAKAWF